MSRANWLVLGLVLVLGGSVAVARDARVFPLSPSGSGGAGGSGGDVTLAGDNDFTGRNRFLLDAGIQARTYNATTSAMYGTLVDAGIQTSDGGGLGMTHPAAYNCSGVVNGVPCVANPYGIVEIYGSLPAGTNTDFVCAVEMYDYNDLGGGTGTCVMGLGVGATSTKIVRFHADGSMYLAGDINMTGGRKIVGPSSGYIEIKPSPGAGGVGTYFSVAGGGLASSGSILAFYNPGYSGSNVAQVEYDGALISGSARTKGTITIGGGGTGTATVVSGSVCTCSNTAALNAVRCSVATTTLTATGTAADVIAYVCL